MLVFRRVAISVGVVGLSLTIGACSRFSASEVSAGQPSPETQPTPVAVSVSVPSDDGSARPLIVAVYKSKGESDAFANCVVDQVGKRFSGSELAFAYAVLSRPLSATSDEVAAAVTASGNTPGKGDPNLPERIFAVQDACRSVDQPPGSLDNPPGSAVPTPSTTPAHCFPVCVSVDANGGK